MKTLNGTNTPYVCIELYLWYTQNVYIQFGVVRTSYHIDGTIFFRRILYIERVLGVHVSSDRPSFLDIQTPIPIVRVGISS